MQISKEASKEFMKKLDQDGNGQVDFLEFVTFMIDGQAVTSSDQKEIHSNPSVNESSDDVCTAAFSIFDADKDGLISPSDLRWFKMIIYRLIKKLYLRQALQKFGMNLTEDEAKEIIVSNSSISDNHLRLVFVKN